MLLNIFPYYWYIVKIKLRGYLRLLCERKQSLEPALRHLGFLTLQLEDILTPKKIETTDSKIKTFSILATGEMNRKIIDQVIIEGLQDFEQYMKINLINIEISDSEIQTKLLFYSKKK